MASKASADRAGGEAAAEFGTVRGFAEVFQDEIAIINQRRIDANDPRGQIVPEIESFPLERDTRPNEEHEPVWRPNKDAAIVGLALSGGGIRSASFCLGALQALHVTGVLPRVDYLSTVSGGGYIGCSLTAGQESTKGSFPFASRLAEDETPSVQHIRDYSNYLFPNGAMDLLENAAIYVRGLSVNASLIAPFLLFFAAITILVHPTAASLPDPSVFGVEVPNFTGGHFFVVTKYLSLILVALMIVWGVIVSAQGLQRETEIPNFRVKVIGAFVLLLLFSAFCELQPYVLAEIFDPSQKGWIATLSQSVSKIATALAPVATIIAFFGRKLGEFVKSGAESPSKRVQMAAIAARAAIYFAALVVPLVLWAIYLQFSYWGMCLNEPACAKTVPTWLAKAVYWIGPQSQPSAYFYLLVALLLVLLSLLLSPNANSLHPLYRDRLGKAFLFEPKAVVAPDEELKPYKAKLSELTGRHGPYHLINAALNIQDAKTTNRRGRNADFFLLSQKFIGSKATGYVATEDMEEVSPGLDLATAMAVSGAAASSNMGAQSIKPLTPTLAILNIRLGYWLRNPFRVAKREYRNIVANFYFLYELFGLLSDRKKSVYLTDGGHIENLGIYELLRRRCKVIIAVDAEADPQMAFGSLNTVERYARIDLGVGIDLPWQKITDMTRATGDAIDKVGNAPKNCGPHVVVGEIRYPGGRNGILVYIKASLSGDENDYIFHYKKRYDSFPHETTLDQMFSEEQFEAYRALGFHAAYRFFDRRDHFAHLEEPEFPCVRKDLTFLDQLFPLNSQANPCWPRQCATFADWLSEDTAAEAEAAAAKIAAAASPAMVAEAATKIAAAAEAAVKPAKATTTVKAAKPAKKGRNRRPLTRLA